jgi:hypothetical protein
MRFRVLIAAILLSFFSAHARKHEHYGEGFSIDLPEPYDLVLGTVREVVNDGVIRGTFPNWRAHSRRNLPKSFLPGPKAG